MKQLFQTMAVIAALVFLSVSGFWLMNLRSTTDETPMRFAPQAPSATHVEDAATWKHNPLPTPVKNAAILKQISLLGSLSPRAITHWDGASENIVFSRDGRWFAQSTSSAVEIRRTKDWKLSLLFGGRDTFALSGDFRLLATTDGFNKINVWRLRDRKLLHSLEGANAVYWPLSFSPDNLQLAAIGLPEWLTSREGPTNGYPQPVSKEFRVWKLDGAKAPRLQAGPVTDLDEGVGIAWTKAKSGQTVAWKTFCFAGYGDSKLVAGHTIWVRVGGNFIEARDDTTGELISRVRRPSKMGPIALAPGATLFAGAAAADSTVYIWRLADAKLLGTIKKQGAQKALSLAFSSDARQLAISFLAAPKSPNNPTTTRQGSTVIYDLNSAR